MSVAFNSKSGEVGGDSWTLMPTDDRSKNGGRSQCSGWWIGAAAVCLGLLLLTVILVAHNTSAINHWDTKYENLIYNLSKERDTTLRAERDQLKIHFSTKYENLIYNLSKERDTTLRAERDRLKIHLSNLTKEMEALQSQYNTVAASRDKLQEEVNRLNLSRTGKPCHQGWREFKNRCYYASPDGAKTTWENSRKDCLTRGADLVIINTRAELEFVTATHSITWIGLSDKHQEDKWKWVDGTDLVGAGFWQVGEPNNHENEDCVEVSREAQAWNDVPCDRKFPWVCQI